MIPALKMLKRTYSPSNKCRTQERCLKWILFSYASEYRRHEEGQGEHCKPGIRTLSEIKTCNWDGRVYVEEVCIRLHTILPAHPNIRSSFSDPILPWVVHHDYSSWADSIPSSVATLASAILWPPLPHTQSRLLLTHLLIVYSVYGLEQ